MWYCRVTAMVRPLLWKCHNFTHHEIYVVVRCLVHMLLIYYETQVDRKPYIISWKLKDGDLKRIIMGILHKPLDPQKYCSLTQFRKEDIRWDYDRRRVEWEVGLVLFHFQTNWSKSTLFSVSPPLTYLERQHLERQYMRIWGPWNHHTLLLGT